MMTVMTSIEFGALRAATLSSEEQSQTNAPLQELDIGIVPAVGSTTTLELE